jgi:predicted metalloprotease
VLGTDDRVGDHRIQERATGPVDRESWTHGSAAARQKWFDTGHRAGDPRRCDTFAPGAL